MDVNLHTLKTSSDIDLRLSVEDVEVFTSCPEVSQPSDSEHTTKPIKSNSATKNRTFEVGDQVVVKDVGGIYQGARGKIVDILYSRTGTSYLVRFDKLIRNTQQIECEGFDLMKL